MIKPKSISIDCAIEIQISPSMGLLTEWGYAWGCTICGYIFAIASDNIVPIRCSKCQGPLRDATEAEVISVFGSLTIPPGLRNNF